jgi:hypothetical protein
LSRRDQILWAVSILLAITMYISGMYAKNAAELHHTEAGLYRLMPGIVLGLFVGFFLNSPNVVLIVTIAANAAVYRLLLKGSVWIYFRLVSPKQA